MKRSRQLQVIDDPAPPRGGGDPGLPILQEANLGWDDLDCVLADLDDFTSIRELQGRVGGGTPEPLQDLLDARSRFIKGDVEGLQIIYEFADQVWIDTLIRHPTGARLLRMLSPR